MQKIVIGREYPDVITKLVKNAKQSVKILIFDWRWYDGQQGSRIQQLNNEILFASQRGVAVSAVLNSNIVHSLFQHKNIKIKQVNSKKTMHVKMIIIDDQWLLLGSHNLTMNAFEVNHEISVLIDDPEAIKRCNQFFESICLL
jgi:phosphatidylserine/phosphatidylglycerophosphate/cardiolipin synthase-like enzyme